MDTRALAQLWTHRHDGGTFSPRSGRDASPKKGFAVGGVCASLVLDENVTRDEFEALVNTWERDHLPKRRTYVGVWFDNESRKIFIDGTDLVSNKNNALEVASRRGELAVWDFEHGEEIRVALAA